jgi:hypothetical protein
METIVKNIHLLKDLLSEQVIEQIENRALQYRKFARITFKVLSVFRDTVTIETRQNKSPAENYLGQKDLFERTKSTFAELYANDGLTVHVNTHRYVETPVEIVTPEYVRSQMIRLKIKQKHMVDNLGLDAPAVSSWVNGNREMSNPVKVMFYLYFKLCETGKLDAEDKYFKSINSSQRESGK